MAWPLSQDYNEALQNPQTSFNDAELRRGQVVVNVLGIPQPCSGNFADVYAVECPASKTKWAVKCFTREVHGLRERYSEISKYLQQTHLPFTVDFQYLEQGIRIGGHWYPILKMHWVEGFTLNAFVRDMLDKPAMLEGLSRIWLRMAQRLREAKLAHADLQHGNVLLVPGSNASSLAVKLIDYDGMWVPSLANKPSGEVGHPSYQHPQRLREGGYNQEVDRFPLLAIYVALRALVVGGRQLWERYDNGDNLLFRQADFEAPGRSPLFAELIQINDPLTRSLVELLAHASEKPLEQTPLFQHLVPDEKPTASAATRGKAPALPQATTETNAFQDIETTTASTRSRRKKTRGQGTSVVPWLVGGVVAACVLLGGAVFWAMHSKSLPDKSLSDPDQSQARADRIDAKKKPEEKNKREDKPPTQPSETTKPADTPSTPTKPKPTDKPVEPADMRVPILDGPPGEVQRFEGHTDGVPGVAFSPDGKRALSGSGDKTVRLWDIASGKELQCLRGHTSTVWAVSFSPDGKRAVSAGFDNTVRLWDLDKGEEIRAFQGHTSNVRSAVFTPDGKQLISTSHDRTVRVWDAETGREVRQYKGNNSDAYGMTLSSDGKRVLCVGGDKVVRCWDTENGNELDSYAGSAGVLYTVAISHDGKFIAAGGADNVVRIWQASEPAAPRYSMSGHSAQVNALSFTPDGLRLLSASADGTIRLWDVASGRELGRYYGAEDCEILGVAISLDGRCFLSGGSDKLVRLWRLLPPDVLAAKLDDPVGEVQCFRGHRGPIRRVGFSSDGRRVLSAGHDNTARVWETSTGHELLAFKGHTNREVHSIAFLPDSRHALSSGDDNFLRLWDVIDGHEIRRFEGHGAPVHHLAISPDSRRALSCHPTKGVILWNLEMGTIIYRLAKEPEGAGYVSFSADGRWGISGVGETISLWDLKTGERARQFKSHKGSIMSVVFSPDDRLILSSSTDKTARLWDVESGKEVQRFEGHTAPVWGAALSPDGRRMVSAGLDRTVRLWDVATGIEFRRFTGHSDGILDVAFSPDGRYALSGSIDRTLRLCRLPFAPFVVGQPLELRPKEIPAISKQPVPDEAVLKSSTEEVRNIYKVDYDAARKPGERSALAAKLFERGMRPKEIRRVVSLASAKLAISPPAAAMSS